jgi:tRNA-modifying protein YgfZ
MSAEILPHRGVIRVSGAEATSWLNGLLTNSVPSQLKTLTSAALLSAQGKVLFDLMLHPAQESTLIDAPHDSILALLQRLKMYALRAKILLEDVSDQQGVWVDSQGHEPQRDPRDALMGYRWVAAPSVETSILEYTRRRMAAIVPESGTDYLLGDVFPHDIMMDVQHGIDFKKGCFIGQEVVSRVEHRGTARTRFVRLKVEDGSALPSPHSAVMAQDDRVVGTIGTRFEGFVLAKVRMDRLMEATHLHAENGAPFVIVPEQAF